MRLTYEPISPRCHYEEKPGALNYTSRMAVGVAGLISPWNLPLYLLTFKLAPALASGNTVVCKPSEMTSVTAWMMCDAAHKAGTNTLLTSPLMLQESFGPCIYFENVESALLADTYLPSCKPSQHCRMRNLFSIQADHEASNTVPMGL